MLFNKFNIKSSQLYLEINKIEIEIRHVIE